MKNKRHLRHEFVEYISDELMDGTIYISIAFATAAHKCCCGCGNEVITPLSPKEWQLIFDGESISLYPSIGNWSFDCKSHYWITNSKVEWARKWSQKEINVVRHQDYLNKKKYHGEKSLPPSEEINANHRESKNDKLEIKHNFWLQLKKWRGGWVRLL